MPQKSAAPPQIPCKKIMLIIVTFCMRDFYESRITPARNATVKYYADDVASLCKFLQTFASFCNVLSLFYCRIKFILFYTCGRL